jgi:hypothetical protein
VSPTLAATGSFPSLCVTDLVTSPPLTIMLSLTPSMTLLSLLLFTFIPYAQAYPHSFADVALSGRTVDPVFPPSPPSCPICAKDWPSMDSCALACPVLANFSMVRPLLCLYIVWIFDTDLHPFVDHLQPGSFCRRDPVRLHRDLFSSVSSMCRLVSLISGLYLLHDSSKCHNGTSFVQTNQSQVLDAKDLPSVLDGMRRICAIKSTLLGGSAYGNGQATRASSSPPGPTVSSRAESTTLDQHAAAIGLSCLLGLGALVL